MPRWDLSCLLCGDYDGTDLVALQEHAMHAHGVTADQLRRVTRRGPIALESGAELYEWRLPADSPWGTWLRAVRRTETEDGDAVPRRD